MSTTNHWPLPSRVASPCVNVCRIDDDTGLCAGCLRTLDEIALWSQLDDAMRQDVLDAIVTRRAQRKEP